MDFGTVSYETAKGQSNLSAELLAHLFAPPSSRSVHRFCVAPVLARAGYRREWSPRPTSSIGRLRAMSNFASLGVQLHRLTSFKRLRQVCATGDLALARRALDSGLGPRSIED
jgi:hypothetical protein